MPVMWEENWFLRTDPGDVFVLIWVPIRTDKKNWRHIDYFLSLPALSLLMLLEQYYFCEPARLILMFKYHARNAIYIAFACFVVFSRMILHGGQMEGSSEASTGY